MEHEHDQGAQDEQSEGRLTDELLEEKLREGKGALPFIPGGEKSEPPVPGVHTRSRVDAASR
jgi:hypothetical protein